MPKSHPIASLSDLFLPGKFALAQSILNTPGLETTYNGRGALMRACIEIARGRKRDILLPAFHCPSGITPAILAGLNPIFYRIRRDLSVDYEDLLSKVRASTGAVLIIHFFGFRTNLKPLATLHNNNIILIEDWSHSFLEGDPVHLSACSGDYGIFSFWKLVPSSVGGGLYRRNGLSPNNSPPPPLKERLVRTKRIFEEALDNSDHHIMRAAFHGLERARLALKSPPPQPNTMTSGKAVLRGEDHYPIDLVLAASAMPRLARQIIEASDPVTVAASRRNNYRHYAELLADCDGLAIPYPTLPDGTCPWVFPILLHNRDQIDRRWRKSGVALHTFGSYLHSALFKTNDDPAIADAKYLAENLLCLSIHQGITLGNINKSSAIICRTLRNAPQDRSCR